MKANSTPIAIEQTIVKSSVSTVFSALTNPHLVTLIWGARSTSPIEEGAELQWHWPLTEELSRLKVVRVVPDKHIAMQWIDSQITVIYELEALTETRTLLTFKSIGFKEEGEHLWRAIASEKYMHNAALQALNNHLSESIKAKNKVAV